MKKLNEYILNRLKESSTWRSLIIILTAFGLVISPEQQDAIISTGLMLAGLLGAISPDDLV
jgi:hypothetical protein